MSLFQATPDLAEYVDRGVKILQEDGRLAARGASVLAQQPPLEESPSTSIMPVVFVGYSQAPLRGGSVETVGRATVDAAGPLIYHLEFYNVAVVRGATKEAAQREAQGLAMIIRDAYQRNTRLVDPDTGEGPLASTTAVAEVPYVLRSSNKDVYAINVMCRPDVPVQFAPAEPPPAEAAPGAPGPVREPPPVAPPPSGPLGD